MLSHAFEFDVNVVNFVCITGKLYWIRQCGRTALVLPHPVMFRVLVYPDLYRSLTQAMADPRFLRMGHKPLNLGQNPHDLARFFCRKL